MGAELRREAAHHDTEWGRPAHDDRHLFEMLLLEGAQAGLSWSTVLTKIQEAFGSFDTCLWDWVKGAPSVNHPAPGDPLPRSRVPLWK